MTDTSYATLVELKAVVQITSTDASRDVVLQNMLNAAAETIDRVCNRPDGFLADTTASARTYTGSGEAVQDIDECTAITLVEVKDSATDDDYTSWAATDYLAFSGDPRNPNFNSTPYTRLMTTLDGDYAVFTAGYATTRGGFRPPSVYVRAVPTVRVTAKWGYATAVPEAVSQATILQAARWFKRGQGSWADSLGNPELGTLMFQKAIDPDLQLMLIEARLMRPTIG